MSSEGWVVSVVTTFLDAEKFLREAIESVRAQTFPHWEHLLVDDGSTDSSTRIAREYAVREPERFRYIEHSRHANLGISASRNAGIRAARGRMIALLDADDVYLPDKLERQVAILDAHSAAEMVYGPSLNWHSWTGRLLDFARDRPRKLGCPPDTLVEPPVLLRRLLDRKAWPPIPCSVLIRRAAIERVGGFEDDFRSIYDDQVFFYKLLLEFPVFVEGQGRDRYRQHPESICHRAIRSGVWVRGRVPNPVSEVFWRWMDAYFEKKNVTDPAIRRALARELRPYNNPALYRLMTSRWRVIRKPVQTAARFLDRFIPGPTS